MTENNELTKNCETHHTVVVATEVVDASDQTALFAVAVNTQEFDVDRVDVRTEQREGQVRGLQTKQS